MIAEGIRHDVVVDLLREFGYLRKDAEPTAAMVEAAVTLYQRNYGLTDDGFLGPLTMRHLDAPRFCRVPDRMNVGGTRCRWDSSERPLKITWHATGDFTGYNAQERDAEIGKAWGQWRDVCGINPVWTPNPKTANVLTDVGRIDQPGGTLAYMQLPCGPDQQLTGRFDSSEPWKSTLNFLLAVATHEIGHALGLDHGPDNNLMFPSIIKGIYSPQAWDISEAQLRYGPPAAAPPPPDPSLPEPPIDGSCVMRAGGKTYRGVLIPQ